MPTGTYNNWLRLRHLCLSIFIACILGDAGCYRPTFAEEQNTSVTKNTTDTTTSLSSSSAMGSTSETDPTMNTSNVMTSTTSTTTTTTSTTTSTATATTSTSTETASTGIEPQPDGSMCSADAECISNKCFVVPLLGGICGECEVDADCDNGGCTFPNPISNPVKASVCNLGEKGAGCMSDAICVDPNAALCGLVFDASPILEVFTCGECKTNADCTDPQTPNCSPNVDITNFTGILECVPDGSVPNNSSCNRMEENNVPIGNAACQSGKCGTASVMGVVQLGICGECLTDTDCDPGKTCQDAEVNSDTLALVGAKCIQ